MNETIDQHTILKRKILWDSVPYYTGSSLIPKAGMLSGSAEGDAVEMRLSQARLNRLRPIESELILHSALAGEMIGRAILDNQGIEGVGIEHPQIQHYMKVVSAGVMGVLANLVDTGLVKIQGA